jgi:hypothetical protein
VAVQQQQLLPDRALFPDGYNNGGVGSSCSVKFLLA